MKNLKLMIALIGLILTNLFLAAIAIPNLNHNRDAILNEWPVIETQEQKEKTPKSYYIEREEIVASLEDFNANALKIRFEVSKKRQYAIWEFSRLYNEDNAETITEGLLNAFDKYGYDFYTMITLPAAYPTEFSSPGPGPMMVFKKR